MHNVTANIIIIGNEILSGRTQDINANFLAKQLLMFGIIVTQIRIIRDDEQEIIDNLRELKSRATYIFTTGGIGPTHDDVTSSSIAKALGKKLIRHLEAEKILRDYYGTRLNQARLSMANMPEGAILIDNPISKAPGYQIENIFVLAGVPGICRAMFEKLAPTLNKQANINTLSIKVDIAEGDIAEELSNLQQKWSNISIGSYPYNDESIYGTELVLNSTDAESLKIAFNELKSIINHYTAKNNIAK